MVFQMSVLIGLTRPNLPLFCTHLAFATSPPIKTLSFRLFFVHNSELIPGHCLSVVMNLDEGIVFKYQSLVYSSKTVLSTRLSVYRSKVVDEFILMTKISIT